MFKPLKYNRLKKVIDDKEEKLIVEVDKYNPDTGDPIVEEHMIDPDKLDTRKQLLQAEIDKINTIQDNITNNVFDKVENNRTTKV